MTIHDSVTALIGGTPLVRLNHVTEGIEATIAVKVEYLNPGGSSKDRIAARIIEDAERSGKLRPGGVIVEPTSGNTGVGLALVAQQRGYRTVFVVPDKVSESKRAVLRAYGAEVVVTPTDVEPDDPRSYYSVSDRLASSIPGAFKPNQYRNPQGPESHYRTTGPEIWQATQGRITHFVAGIGTGGTISGTGRYLREVSHGAVSIIGADPAGSIYSDPDDVHRYDVEGVGEDFYPQTFDRSVTDAIVQVDDAQAFAMTRRLAALEGLLVGGSSGMAVQAAVRYARERRLGADQLVVVLLPDSGRGYLEKIFDDEWMRGHGYADVVQATAAEPLAGALPVLTGASLPPTASSPLSPIRRHPLCAVIRQVSCATPVPIRFTPTPSIAIRFTPTESNPTPKGTIAMNGTQNSPRNAYEDTAIATRAIHAGQEPDPMTGAVVPPIYMTSTFKQDGVGGLRGGYDYSRSANPTRDAFTTQLAAVEGAGHALAFASGLAAIDVLLRSTLRPGENILLGNDVYGGTYRLLSKVFVPWGVGLDVVDTSDAQAVSAALHAKDYAYVWVETPSNPLLGITDIAATAALAHARGAKVAVDNTFASPILQRPLEDGADVVVYSTTKYIGGHSDVVGGAIVLNDDSLAERIAFLQNSAGAVPSPFDSWLDIRGLKTLQLRVMRHSENAMRLAQWLQSRPEVERVWYPGLTSHPGHAIAARQMHGGFGGMISIQLRDGIQAAKRLVAATRIFTLAESLGGVESLIEHPAAMTHASVSGTTLEVPENLVRLSVGVEDADDLIADLAQAFSVR